jgi:dTDP-4-amino-4,6-dideoxygalactose transaminase
MQNIPIIPFGKPLLGAEERAAVDSVLRGSTLVHGPKAVEFEEAFADFTSADAAVSVSSCTAGMHLAYFALGLGPGDEVIVPAQTHVATAHAVRLTGATVVFVDSENHTGNVDTRVLESAVTSKTRAIAVVHYLGVPANMGEISEIAKRHKLFVVEDCALALGARVMGTHVGLFGDVGVFSFYPVKHMTTTEGGMIITKDAEFAARLRLLRAFGVDRTHGERSIPGMYDTVDLGFNYRMSEVNAAIGVVQLGRVSGFLNSRRENFERLAETLEGSLPKGVRIVPQPCNEFMQSSHYCMSVMLSTALATRRVEIMKYMSEHGVGTSIYYPHPVPRMSYYRLRATCELQTPVAARFSDQSLALPVGPHLSKMDCDYVAQTLLNALDKFGAQL